MKVLMKQSARLKDVGRVLAASEDEGFRPQVVREGGRVTVCVPGADPDALRCSVGGFEEVEALEPFRCSYKRVSREFRKQDTVISVRGVPVGGGEPGIIAGPCAVESRDNLLEAATAVKEGGAHMLRGGAFKPRSSPYAFQGLKRKGLEYLAEARDITGLPVVTEVMSPGDVELVSLYADVLQVGSRNMQNFPLLEALGSAERPVLLKRGMSATIEEFLQAAEYVAASGNPDVILCERGIRTFERRTRNTLDVGAVAVLKDLSHLPVIVDPSHSTGDRRYVIQAALAGVAAGANGLIVEVHPCPDDALVDGAQSLTPEAFSVLVAKARDVALAVR